MQYIEYFAKFKLNDLYTNILYFFRAECETNRSS